jgi:phosphatidylglycerophosphatase A
MEWALLTALHTHQSEIFSPMNDTGPQIARQNVLKYPAILLATWFGSGLLPKAPGTWGTLAALPFAWALQTSFSWMILALATVLVFFIGIWASNGYVARVGGEDPGAVVIDEVAGIWLTLVPAAYLSPYAPDLMTYAVAFVLFRLADIFKPWPASWADKNIHGGAGIMLDDIIAAVFSAIGLTLYLVYLGG